MKKLFLFLFVGVVIHTAAAQSIYEDVTPNEDDSNGTLLMGMLFSVVGVLLYFMPAILARKHRQSNSILLLNLLLGWTIIGWVAALVWAFSNDTPAPVIATKPVAPVVQQPSVADELEKLQRLREQGVLSEEEFIQQKAKALSAS